MGNRERKPSSIEAENALKSMPGASSHAIARYLTKTHPLLYASHNAAWCAVKYERKRLGIPSSGISGKHELPKPVEQEAVKPLDLSADRTLVLSDVHVPYHDMPALSMAVEYGVSMGVDAVVLLGDILDFFAVSRWEKDPRKRNLPLEIERGREFFKSIRSTFPDARIIWKLGNHEERWNSFLYARAPELVGCEFVSLENMFGTEDLDIETIDRMQHVRIDYINLIHGHEFGKSVFSPVNPARGLFLRSKATALCGHSHQTSAHVETNMNRTVTGCWSLGCLCDLQPRYAPYNKWNHGFAIVTREGDLSRVDNLKIINGRVI
jgi:predicted phosphodiesterase